MPTGRTGRSITISASLSAVDGFDTPTPLFQQKGWNPRRRRWTSPGIDALPYRINTTGDLNGWASVNDPDHQWIAAHLNGGATTPAAGAGADPVGGQHARGDGYYSMS